MNDENKTVALEAYEALAEAYAARVETKAKDAWPTEG
jgi:hypothetical protein